MLKISTLHTTEWIVVNDNIKKYSLSKQHKAIVGCDKKRISYVIALPNLIEKAGQRQNTKRIFSDNKIFLNGCTLSWMLVEPQIMWADESLPLREKTIVSPHYLQIP